MSQKIHNRILNRLELTKVRFTEGLEVWDINKKISSFAEPFQTKIQSHA